MVERICSETVLFLFVLLFKLFIQDVENIRFFVSTLFLQPCPRKKFPCTIRSKEKGSPALSGDRIERHQNRCNPGQKIERQNVERANGPFDLLLCRCFVPTSNRRCRRQVLFFSYHIISVEMLFRIKTPEMGFKVRKNRQFSSHLSLLSVEVFFFSRRHLDKGFDNIFEFAVPPLVQAIGLKLSNKMKIKCRNIRPYTEGETHRHTPLSSY